MKISESIVYVISQRIFWGQGNIAESFAETLGKMLGKCCEFQISPKQI